MIMEKFTSCERNKTASRQGTSQMIKVFILEFIDSCLIITIVNMKVKKNILMLSGTLDDFGNLWFSQVGLIILETMLLNLIMSLLITCVFVSLQYFSKCCYSFKKVEDLKKKKFFVSLLVNFLIWILVLRQL